MILNTFSEDLSNRVFRNLSLSFFLFFTIASLSYTACSGPSSECSTEKACPEHKFCQDGICMVKKKEKASVEKVREMPRDVGDAGHSEKVPEPVIEKEIVPDVYRWGKTKSGTTKDLWGVHMLSDKIAWVVGASGLVLRTNDGGKAWKKQTSGVSTTLRDVFFINEKQGWIVGDKGTLLSTEDGGKKWKKNASIVSENLWRVQFFDKENGYIAGEKFSLFKTRNFGKTWQSSSAAIQLDLFGMHYTSIDVGYVAGGSGMVLYTRNANDKLSTVATGTTIILRSIHFATKEVGWAIGDKGIVIYSDDYGEGWDVRRIPELSGDLKDIAFISEMRGWVVGEDGLLVGTSDGGKNWRSELKGKNPDFHALSVLSEKAAIVVGKGGVIIHIRAEKAECQIGQERECYQGASKTKGVGLCKAGKQLCKMGFWKTCEGVVLPTKERCFDEDDNDCDGKVDEGCPACQDGAVRDCYTGDKNTVGVGECSGGKKYCKQNKWSKCKREVLPTTELCNGRDDDCDGKIDENPKLPSCHLSKGVCASAKKTCLKGRLQHCKESDYGTAYQKREVKCDNLDNDCDGQIDEGCPCKKEGATQKCYTGQTGSEDKGLCKSGKQFCKKKKWTICLEQIRPVQEVCKDGKDNDCDGKTDEDCP